MATCAKCGKLIPSDEMTSRKGVMDILGVKDSENDPLSNMFRSMSASTQAWKCDTCGDWICNSCVCQAVISSGAGQIRHSNCGGMFKAPR